MFTSSIVWKRLFGFLAAFAFSAAAALADSTADNAKNARELLQKAVALLEQCHQAIEPSDFDARALAGSFGKDVAPVFAFVRDGIAYQPYTGALRGADGCLRSRSGNATDKALLLAELLRHNDHEVRLVTGTLTPDLAGQLVEDSLLWETDEEAADLEFPYAFDDPILKAEQAEITKRAQERVLTRLLKLTPVLAASLPLSDKTAGEPIDDIAKEVTAHVWVQVKQNGNWLNLDPSFALAEPGDSFAEPRETDAAWLESQWHRIKFRGIIERYADGKVSEESLWDLSYRAAELSGKSVVASCSPELTGVALLGDKLAGKSSRCLRLYVDGQRAAGIDFDCAPPPVPPREGDVFVPTFPFGRPASAANDPFIVGVLIEITIESPGRPPVLIRRPLLDLWPASDRAQNDSAVLKKIGPSPAPLKRMDQLVLSFAVETGVVSPAWIQKRGLEACLEKYRTTTIANNKITVSGSASDALLREFGDVYFHLRDKLAAGLFDQPGLACTPRIVMTALDNSDAKKPRLDFDITHDPQRFLREGLDQPADTVLKAGLLAAIIEEELVWEPAEPVATNTENLAKLHGGAYLLEQSLARGPPLVLTAGSQLPPASEAATVRICEALNRGLVVVAPRTDSLTVWFEYDPHTGYLETTADNGYHNAGTERATLEGKNSGKSTAGLRFSKIIRNIKNCLVDNIDTIIDIVAAHASGGVSVDNVIDGLAGARDCISKFKGSKFKPKAKRPRNSQSWDTGKNAKKLRDNMNEARKRAGKPPLPKNHEAHHAVSSTHRKAWEARSILEKYGIDINDAANGIGLTERQHSGVHSYRYMNWVTDMLRQATSRESARDILGKIAAGVTGGRRPWNNSKFDDALWHAIVHRWLEHLGAFVGLQPKFSLPIFPAGWLQPFRSNRPRNISPLPAGTLTASA